MADVLYLHTGNTAEWSLPITNADGSIKTLSGVTDLLFLVKRRIDDADMDAVITATPVVADASAGIIEIRLSPADTDDLDPGVYVWGLQFTDSLDKSWEFPAPGADPGKLIIRRGVVAVVPA